MPKRCRRPTAGSYSTDVVARGALTVQDHPRAARRRTHDSRPTAAEVGEDTQRYRLELVSSSGAQLLQLHRLEPRWRRHDRFWVTFDLPVALPKPLMRRNHVSSVANLPARNL